MSHELRTPLNAILGYSELVIDEFVYDPSSNAGKLGARVTKGVFRFISGKIAHENPQDMELKLPSGTLGVRGTMVAGRVDAAQKSSRLVLLGEGPENDTGAPVGAFEACNAGKCVRINRPATAPSSKAPIRRRCGLPLSPDEIDAITRPVSDPEGWVETATSESGGTPTSQRVPAMSPLSARRFARADRDLGHHHGARAATSNTTRERLRTLDRLDQATTDVAQFSSQTVSVNGRLVRFPWTAATPRAACSESLLPGIRPFRELPARRDHDLRPTHHARGERPTERSTSGRTRTHRPQRAAGRDLLTSGSM
jgi:hypothetical protein